MAKHGLCWATGSLYFGVILGTFIRVYLDHSMLNKMHVIYGHEKTHVSTQVCLPIVHVMCVCVVSVNVGFTHITATPTCMYWQYVSWRHCIFINECSIHTEKHFLELKDYAIMMDYVMGLHKPMLWQNHLKNISEPRPPKSVQEAKGPDVDQSCTKLFDCLWQPASSRI